MKFKTKKYYKKRVEDLEFQNYCWQITLQDTIEENERLKSEIDQLKSEKTIQHVKKQIEVEEYYYPPSKINIQNLYQKLKYKVISEFDKNFEKYVKVSPIIEYPRECRYKQFATIQIERGC